MSLKGSNISRLRQIEKAMRTKSLTDHLVVIEDHNQPGVFKGRDKDGVERIWSEEELEAYLGQVIKVVYVEMADPYRGK